MDDGQRSGRLDRQSGPLVRARAPLRIGLAGGGTDVAPFSTRFGGMVLNVTTDLYAHAAVQPNPDGKLVIETLDEQGRWEGPASLDLDMSGPGLLAKGVYRHFMQRYNQGVAMPLTIYSGADVPAGSGLGTSSALVVALVEAFARVCRAPMGPYEVAHLAYEIERIDLKLSGGQQDQYAAAFGGFNLIEFGPGDTVLVNPLRISASVLAEFEASLVLFFTGVSRESANIIEQQTSRISGGDEASIDAMHALKAGAVAMKQALLRGELRRVAQILDQGYAQKRKTATSIATPDIDQIYNAAKAAGAIGGKVSGAGGGGFMVFLADPLDRPRLLRTLETAHGRVFPCRLTDRGSFAWSVTEDGSVQSA